MMYSIDTYYIPKCSSDITDQYEYHKLASRDSHVTYYGCREEGSRKNVRHGISTDMGVKVRDYSRHISTRGSNFESHRRLLTGRRFINTSQKGSFGGALALGTVNGQEWELSSQISLTLPKLIIFQSYTYLQ